MAWYPKATRVPISRVGPRIKPVGVVLHTAVSNSSNLKPWGTVTWHFYVNKQGKVFQYVDTENVAYCQLDGNYFNGKGFVSIETWDGAGVVWDGRNVANIPSWNTAQMNALVDLVAWLSKTHGFPAVRATGPHGTGIGWHRQYTGSSYPRWNGSHACPGNRRINQVASIIDRVNQHDDTPSDWWDMFKNKKELRDFISDAVWTASTGEFKDDAQRKRLKMSQKAYSMRAVMRGIFTTTRGIHLYGDTDRTVDNPDGVPTTHRVMWRNTRRDVKKALGEVRALREELEEIVGALRTLYTKHDNLADEVRSEDEE